jgi:hypothetical protein
MTRLSFLVLALALPAAVEAQEATLVLPQGAEDDLAPCSENESLTLSLRAEGLTSPQD